MGWPKELVLVRHAESLGNVKSVDERASFNLTSHRYGLTDFGKEQAVKTGEYLNDTYGFFDINYTSYYQRTKDTFEIMYPNKKHYEDPRLAEANRGHYHSLTREQLKTKFPEELERKDREGLYHYRPLGGENWPDIELRIHSFLGTLSRDCEDKKVLIVVHGFWFLLFQRLIHHFSISDAVDIYTNSKNHGVIENASVTKYVNEGKHLKLVQYNYIPWKVEGLRNDLISLPWKE